MLFQAIHAFNQMIPLVIATIQAFTTWDEERAIECFELFYELHKQLSVMTHHSKSMVNMCLSIATNESLSDPLKVRALCFVGWLVREKIDKVLLKHKLVEPIVGKCHFAI